MFWMIGQRTNWLAASAERRFSFFQIRVIEAWSTALQMLWYILIHDSGSNQHNNLLLKPSVNSSPDVFANASKTATCELFTLLGHCRVADSSWLHSTHGQSAIARSVSQLPVNTLKTRLLLLWQLNLAEFACPKAVQIWLRSYDFARQSLAVQACNRLRSFSVTPRLQSLSMLTAVTASLTFQSVKLQLKSFHWQEERASSLGFLRTSNANFCTGSRTGFWYCVRSNAWVAGFLCVFTIYVWESSGFSTVIFSNQVKVGFVPQSARQEVTKRQPGTTCYRY